MSSVPKTNDPSILRKLELSKKEEGLKKKLFKSKGTSAKESPEKPTRDDNQTSKRSEAQKKPDASTSKPVKQVVINDALVENFLKDMENEFKGLNKQQITVGMLNTQNNILKQHSEILNENQRAIAQVLKENVNPNRPSVNAAATQKEVLKELLGPVNTQIVEIKKIYEQTKEMAEEVAKNVTTLKKLNDKPEGPSDPSQFQYAQKNMQQAFDTYNSMNSDLKNMVHHAQGNLNQILPENLQIIKQISNLNVEAYTECINTLKKQIQDLQRDAERAEKELQVRYKKLAEINKPSTIKKTDPYYPLIESGPETAEEVIKQIRTIDYVNSREIVVQKLGGEFDYDAYSDEVSEIYSELQQINLKFAEQLHEYRVNVPPSIMTAEDKALLNADIKLPSIIDEIKARYNLPKKAPQIKPRPVANDYLASQDVSEHSYEPSGAALKGKRFTKKPDTLHGIRTNPQEPLPDIEFVKYIDKKEPSFNPMPVSFPEFDSQAKRRASQDDVEEEPRRFVPKTDEKPVRDKTPEKKGVQQSRDRSPKPEPTREKPRDSSKGRSAQESTMKKLQEAEEPKIYLNMDKYEIPHRAEQRTDESKAHGIDTTADVTLLKTKNSDWMMDHLLENMILHDIKEHMISYSISPRFETKEDEKRYLPIETFRDDSKLTIAKENTGFSQPSLINMSNNNYPAYYSNDAVDDNLLKTLTLQALNEKMPEIIKDVKKESNDIFKPVETQPLKPATIDQNILSNQLQANLLAGINGQQLSTLLAENLMGILNNAMLHINTSLSKGLPQVMQAPQVHQNTMQNIQTMASRGETILKKPEDVIITDENPQENPSNKRISPFKKNLLIDIADEERETVPKSYNISKELIDDSRQETLLDKLEREEREIQMEKALLRQQKPFVTSTSSKAMSGDVGEFFKNQFYFVNHEPKPIANLSEYYKELQSDLSSSDGNYGNSISIAADSRRERDREPRMGMDSMQASRSESQILAGYDSIGPDNELPKFGRRGSRQSHEAYSEASQLDTPVSGAQLFNKPLITDNLMKNLHEEEFEPGEVNIHNIFKA